MKLILLPLLIAILLIPGYTQDFELISYLEHNPDDTLSYWLFGIRGVASGCDLDQDGKQEVFVTYYNHGGGVIGYEMTGNALEVVFETDTSGYTGLFSTYTRCIQTGDLDDDGQGEIIFFRGRDHSFRGLYIYEYNGSDNGYDLVYYDRLDHYFTSTEGFFVENFTIDDVDADNKDELIIAFNGSNEGGLYYEDVFAIYSFTGDFPASATLVEEFYISPKDSVTDYGGGSPNNVVTCDTDNDGLREIFCHSWSFGNTFFIESSGANAYTVGNYYHITSVEDYISMFPVAAADLNGDQKDEVYLTIYPTGDIYKIHDTDGNAQNLLASEVVYLGTPSSGGTVGGALAFDFDMNSIPEIYFGSDADKGNDLFAWDGKTFSGWITDELADGFVSKMAAGDLNGNGRSELITGHQDILDTNPHNWILRISEYVPQVHDTVRISDIQYVVNPTVKDTSLMFGDTVVVRGLVLTNPTDLFLGERYGLYIVDPNNQNSPWNGLRITLDDSTVQATNITSLEPGMIVDFTGYVDEYNRQTDLSLLTDPVVPVNIISSSNPLPEPILLNCDSLDDRGSAEKWESMWVRLENVSITDNNLEDNLASITDSTGSLTYLSDYFNWFRTRINDGNYNWPEAGSVLHATGFVRDELSLIGDIYSLNPRTENDLEVVPKQLSVILLSPNGDELWNEDVRHLIKWQANPADATIELLYSTDNGQTYTSLDTTENDGLRGWAIPRTPSTTCKVKIIASDTTGASVSDESDNVFTIVDVMTYSHHTGSLNHTIRNDGMSGNRLISQGTVNEPSLEFPAGSGHHHLYINQLIIGTVADGDTVAGLRIWDNFIPAQPIDTDDRGNYIATNTTYSDNLGLNIGIEEQTYAVDGNTFVIFVYKITNQSVRTYSDFYLASYNDFDVNVTSSAFKNNLCNYDNTNRLAYMWDATSGWTSYVGVRALDKDPYSFRRWAGPEDRSGMSFLYQKMAEPGFDETVGDIQEDYRILLSFGPYELSPGESVTEAFALVTGNGIDELIQASQDAQSFWSETEAPTIGTVSSSPSPATMGQGIAVSATVSDNRGVAQVSLFYRKGGHSTFSELSMTYSGYGFEADIPGSDVTEGGVEFYIYAEDVNANSTTSSIYMPEINVSDNALASLNISGGSAETAYRMISAPLDFNNASVLNVLDEFGAYDRNQWRLFHDAGSNNVEYPDVQQIEIGKAYWIISRDSKTINFPGGTTASVIDFYQLSLAAGWTQLGLPFNYDIAWSDILAESGQPDHIDGPYLYNNGSYNRPANLSPFQGYYIYNGSGSNFTLRIPTRSAGASASKRPTGQGWWAPILARIGQARDELNIVGASPEAKDEKDLFDHLEPPPIGNYISVYFPHDEWADHPGNYAEDIRAESNDGYVWDMEIQTNINDKPIELFFNEFEKSGLPDHFEIILIDADIKVGWDLRQNQVYSIPSPGPDQPKTLRLIIGTDEYITKHEQNFDIVPEKFVLKQNYPNPFNPETQIIFGLPKEDHVSVVIYSLLGERVCILVDGEKMPKGFHSLRWDGRDQFGNKVSSGVYLYQIRTTELFKTKKMVLLR